MKGVRFIFIKLVILFVGHLSGERCDEATTAQVHEGNLGQSGDFNWLGVLHVHLQDEAKLSVAMTGIVLIKLKYALANADDVVKIPMAMFKSKGKAMFLASRNRPWTVKPASYVTHPEYEYSTLNTIAVIELDLDDVKDYPLNPICLPSGESFNTSRYLYLTGFTDENQRLEKVIYNIQYLDKQVCEEFYHRAGLSSQKRVPSAYVCGYAPSNHTQCVWDNGMVLVSNVTGFFYLIGFGINGPGCAAPARFIDLFPYFYWINSVVSPDEVYDDGTYRRRDDDEFIPVHELFTNDSLRKSDVVDKDYKQYPFNKDSMQHHIIMPTEDEKALLIIPFKDTWEKSKDACSSRETMQTYKEFFQLSVPSGKMGITTYKLSMYDKLDAVLNCVRLTVDRDCKRSQAILSFKEVLQLKDAMVERTSGETPEELFKFYGGVSRPEDFINDDDEFYRNVTNYDLYIKFEFFERGTLEFEMFAAPEPLPIEETIKLNRRANSNVKNLKQRTTKYGEGMVKGADHNMLREAEVIKVVDGVVEEIADSNSEQLYPKVQMRTSNRAMVKRADDLLREAQASVEEEGAMTEVPDTQSEQSYRRAKPKVQITSKYDRGMVKMADYNMVKEPEVRIAADNDLEKEPEMQSAAYGEEVTAAAVAVICLIGTGLRRAMFIN